MRETSCAGSLRSAIRQASSGLLTGAGGRLLRDGGAIVARWCCARRVGDAQEHLARASPRVRGGDRDRGRVRAVSRRAVDGASSPPRRDHRGAVLSTGSRPDVPLAHAAGVLAVVGLASPSSRRTRTTRCCPSSTPASRVLAAFLRAHTWEWRPRDAGRAQFATLHPLGTGEAADGNPEVVYIALATGFLMVGALAMTGGIEAVAPAPDEAKDDVGSTRGGSRTHKPRRAIAFKAIRLHQLCQPGRGPTSYCRLRYPRRDATFPWRWSSGRRDTLSWKLPHSSIPPASPACTGVRRCCACSPTSA